MKWNLLLSALVAGAGVLLSGIGVRAFEPFDDIDKGLRYDILAERTFEGVVASKGHELDGLVYFPLRADDMTMDVQIGPAEFLKHSGFKLKGGELVTVLGMPVVMEGRAVVLAREVRNVTSVLVIRDRNGEPLWQTDRPIQMDPGAVKGLAGVAN